VTGSAGQGWKDGVPPPGFVPKPAWLKKPFDRYDRKREPTWVAELVDAVVDRNGLTDELRACDLLLKWPDIVQERIAKRTRVDGFFKNVLWIRVANSAWLHELTTIKPQLLAAVREAAGDLRVDDLRLHLGDRRDADAGDALAEIDRMTVARREPRRRLPPPPPAVGEARAKIECETARVEDDELREILRDVRIRFDK
jgi:hypothetical protein